MTAGLQDDLRLAHAGELRRALRRVRRRGPAARRCRARRQDQHGRVRDGLVQREQLLRSGAQSLGSRARSGRQLGRLRRGRRRAPRRRGDRHRHRRLDPPARRADRHLRAEAHLRPVLAVRTGRVRLVARHARAVRADRGGLRAPARRDGGARPPRLDVDRPPEGRLSTRPGRAAGGPGAAARGPAHRAARAVLRRRHRRRRRCRGGRRPRRAAPARRDDRPAEPAGRAAVDPGVLRDRPRRGLVEPVALRRRALRPPRRRVRRPWRHVPQVAGGGLRRRGQAAHPGRHLRALARLLRRLLPQGAAGAAPDRRRLPARARGVRRDRGPDVAHARVPAGRQVGRSGSRCT